VLCHSAYNRCGPTLKRKEFCNLFWFHVKSAISLFYIAENIARMLQKSFVVLVSDLLCWNLEPIICPARWYVWTIPSQLPIKLFLFPNRCLVSGDDQPVCSACQSPLTVEHFLIECVNFAAIRSRYFSASSMKDVFENVNAQRVIDFIKEIYFYQEL